MVLRKTSSVIPSPPRAIAIVLLWVAGAATTVSAQPSRSQDPHTPTEAELDERLSEVKHDGERGYQARSTEVTRVRARRGWSWLRKQAGRIPITPPYLLISLGTLGVVLLHHKNKGKLKWLLPYLASWLAVLVGAGMLWLVD